MGLNRQHLITFTVSEVTGLISVYFLVSWGRVRLSPLGTSATNWPIVPSPGAISSGVKRPGREDDQSPTASPLPHTPSWRSA
jgi:hypothetical protein